MSLLSERAKRLADYLVKEGFTLKDELTDFTSTVEIRSESGLAFEMGMPDIDRVNLVLHKHSNKKPEFPGDPGPASKTLGTFFITNEGNPKVWDEGNIKANISLDEQYELNKLITSLIYFVKPNSLKFILEST